MRKPAKQATEQAGGNSPANPSEPNMPNLSVEPYLTMVAIWKAQGQALCEVCGYQMSDSGCTWDPSHKEQ